MPLSQHFQASMELQKGGSPLALGDEMIAVARAQSDSYIEVVRPDAYERFPPNLFGLVSQDAAIKRYILDTLAAPSAPTPPEDVYLTRDAYVTALPLVFTRDLEIFEPSKIDHHTLHPFQYFADLVNGKIPEIDAPAIFIFKAGAQNYGHILVEMLPKLENVAPLITEPTRVLVPPLVGTMAEQLHDIIADLYPGKFVIEVMRSPIVRVRELLYPGPISRHNNRKSRTLLRFADRLRHAALALGLGHVPARLYVSREGVTNRRMVNEVDIRVCFEAQGYTSVHPERMTLLEQVALFAAATRVAGPLGAGLTNIVFSPEQTEILMIDPGFQDFFFWDLACLRRQSFSWHFSAPILPFDVGRLHGDYRVPAEPVRQTLMALSAQG